MSDSELLCALVGTGRSVLQGSSPADLILQTCGGLRGLVDTSMRELSSLRGMGRVRALRVIAALELGRRVACRYPDPGRPLCSSSQVHEMFAARLAPMANEVFMALALDVRARVVGEFRIAEGSMEECPVSPREILRPLLRSRAASTILVHNHPSGDPSPSSQDRFFTMRMAEAGRVVGVRVVDHVIVAAGGWYSFRDDGML